ncbi:dihydrolipoyl dehydrogenase [Candidatus Sumerlaeota bacterium]|nr:dihydrolipoyl dehydrogenase [Candidatus Sumerlaeota bacterium]
MSSNQNYDLVIIGAGPGGYVAAIRAAQLGLKTAAIDKRATPGGTCLHVGCIPSKALLDSSEIYELAQTKFKRHGVEFDNVTLNLPNMMKRKGEVVKGLTMGVLGLMKKNKIDYIQGAGRFLSKTEVEVEKADGSKETLTAKNMLIATGSEPVELPFMKFDHEFVCDSTDALSFDKVPERLVLIGGGVIGLELGSVWRRLGAKVTVIEMLPRILPPMDGECAEAMQKMLKRQGLEFKLGCKVTGCEKTGAAGSVSYINEKGETESVECDKVVVAVGRRPYTSGLDLEAAGVQLDAMKRVAINERFQTSVENIYAIGDAVEGPMLAHKAEEEGVACAEILAGKPGHIDKDTIPNVVYTWPEVASVGKTEEEVKGSGVEYISATFPFMANGRAKAMGEMDGFVKVIAAKEDDALLGVHIVGPRASDMIAEAVCAMAFGGSAEDIARICHAHPTLSEALKEAALGIDGRTIHM